MIHDDELEGTEGEEEALLNEEDLAEEESGEEEI